ncbi:CLUMA_CG016584, isoform A [Clunio marinus]|uniref:CLUMA_CG016584, isoform A n=1 Tax=Clunio marinus TaxID=568069 RepID=A0A1J1ITW5_9DIPT|nr:CLUMA_CG016584, isoform A [Clunio marinus]
MKCSYPPPGCENAQPSPGVCCPDYQALVSPVTKNKNILIYNSSSIIDSLFLTEFACPPQPGCVYQNVPRKLCPELLYCGCMVDGILYSFDSDVPHDDPCRSCYCDYGAVYCERKQCSYPQEGCVYQNIPGQCCPELSYCGCMVDGTVYDFGSYIPVDDPCSVCFCDNIGDIGEVSCEQKECSYPPPEGCVYQNVPGQCCPELSYCGCMVDGTVYDFESEVPNDDPCLSCYCDFNGEVSCMQKECSSPPPGCVYQSVPGKCCPELSYCGCMVDGTVYDFESDVPDDDPCNSCYCDFNGEVSCMQKECSYPPPGCENAQPSPGVCCPDYQALGCETVETPEIPAP